MEAEPERVCFDVDLSFTGPVINFASTHVALASAYQRPVLRKGSIPLEYSSVDGLLHVPRSCATVSFDSLFIQPRT